MLGTVVDAESIVIERMLPTGVFLGASGLNVNESKNHGPLLEKPRSHSKSIWNGREPQEKKTKVEQSCIQHKTYMLGN